jgi:hypothetical protein
MQFGQHFWQVGYLEAGLVDKCVNMSGRAAANLVHSLRHNALLREQRDRYSHVTLRRVLSTGAELSGLVRLDDTGESALLGLVEIPSRVDICRLTKMSRGSSSTIALYCTPTSSNSGR